MGMMRIETRDGRTAFAPREEIVGAAAWALDAPPDALELRLFWYTQGKGTQDVGIVETVRFDRPGRDDRREFRLSLPAAPYSFSGKLVSVLWALELVAEPSREAARLELTMGPAGKEVVLPESAPAGGPAPGGKPAGCGCRTFFL
jgi:hypothetical protein